MQRMEQELNSASRRHIRYVYEHVTRTGRTCVQQVFRDTAPSACPVQGRSRRSRDISPNNRQQLVKRQRHCARCLICALVDRCHHEPVHSRPTRASKIDVSAE